MKKTALLLVAGLAAAFAGAARADGFKPAAVPASVCWIWHVDVQGLKGSETGRALLADPSLAESPQVAAFTARFGLDPAKDLKSLTVYTVSTGRLDAVAVLEPAAAAGARLQAWRETAGYKSQSYGRHTIYGKPGEPGAPYQAAMPDGRIVAALTLDRMQLGLDVLDGKRESLKASALPALSDRKAGDGALVILTGKAFGPDVQGVLPQIALLRKANSLCLVVGEKDGRVSAGLSVCADDDAEAERLQNALLGFVEIGRAMAGDSAQPGFTDTVAVTREGRTIRADGKWTTDQVLKMMGHR